MLLSTSVNGSRKVQAAHSTRNSSAIRRRQIKYIMRSLFPNANRHIARDSSRTNTRSFFICILPQTLQLFRKVKVSQLANLRHLKTNHATISASGSGGRMLFRQQSQISLTLLVSLISKANLSLLSHYSLHRLRMNNILFNAICYEIASCSTPRIQLCPSCSRTIKTLASGRPHNTAHKHKMPNISKRGGNV